MLFFILFFYFLHQTILDRIIWPVEKPMEEEEDEPYSLEIRCTVAGYLCQFIETGFCYICLLCLLKGVAHTYYFLVVRF